MFLELPTELIRADAPVEFRELLDRIRGMAGLTAGQIAAKTGIPRSQCYALTSPKRTYLPTKPDQIKVFVHACGISPIQTGLIMKLWAELGQRASAGQVVVHKSEFGQLIIGDHNAEVFTESSVVTVVGPIPYFRGRAPWAELLFLVLDDPRRTERALVLLRLVLPVVAILGLLIGGVVVFASFNPVQGTTILGGIGVIMVSSIVAYWYRARGRLDRHPVPQRRFR